MAKAKYSVASRRRRKRILKRTKGYWGARSKQYKTAKSALVHSLVYAYHDRKLKKRDFRQLWIARINAACREAGISYSRFMHGLKKAKVELDRKVLAELAINDSKAFKKLVEVAKG